MKFCKISSKKFMNIANKLLYSKCPEIFALILNSKQSIKKSKK